MDGLEEVKRDSVYSRTHLQGEEFPRPSQDLEGTMIQLRESGWKHPCEQIQSLQRSEQQELELQREAGDEEETAPGPTEYSPGRHQGEPRQSSGTPQGGREELHAEPLQRRTQNHPSEQN